LRCGASTESSINDKVYESTHFTDDSEDLELGSSAKDVYLGVKKTNSNKKILDMIKPGDEDALREVGAKTGLLKKKSSRLLLGDDEDSEKKEKPSLKKKNSSLRSLSEGDREKNTKSGVDEGGFFSKAKEKPNNLFGGKRRVSPVEYESDDLKRSDAIVVEIKPDKVVVVPSKVIDSVSNPDILKPSPKSMSPSHKEWNKMSKGDKSSFIG
jgi:hypothetical protein